MKKRFKIGIFCVGILCVGSLVAFLVLKDSREHQIYHKISTVDELYNMKSNRSYQLTTDIDLEGRKWNPLEVKGFNGNGHTIKNAVVDLNAWHSYTNEDTGAFFKDVRWVYNVEFDNIFCKANGIHIENFGLIAPSPEYAKDIVVRNSELIFHQSESSKSYPIGGVIAHSNEDMVENIKVESSRFFINIVGESSKIRFGGIVGDDNYNAGIKNCSLNSSKIIINSISSVKCGGIIGSYAKTIENCVSMENEISIISKNIGENCIGGVAGESKEMASIINCASANNKISIDSENNYVLGGIIGNNKSEISDCLSDSNILEGEISNPSSKNYALIGGICGQSETTISNSIVHDCNISGTSSTKSSTNHFSAGVVAKTTASITYSAVYNNYISGGNKDVFAPENQGMISNCYIGNSGHTSPNVNKIQAIDTTNAEDMLNNLDLSEKYWTTDSGILNLKIVENFKNDGDSENENI